MRAQIQELLRIMKQSEVELTFGYSTMSNRVKNLQLPHKSDDREFIILVQNPNEESYVFNLPQSKLVELKSKGVAKSRNAALKYASGKYLIFGDDDITFAEEGIKTLLQYFEENPQCSIILAQTSDETGILRKSYPTKQHKLTKYNSAKAATYEMMIRTDAIREAGITFDENFGAGVAKTYLGDEYIFICDLLDANLNCVFYPITLAIHPKDSSGSKWGSNEDRVARALVFDRAFKGNFSLPYLARIGFGSKKIGKELSFVNFIKFVFKR